MRRAKIKLVILLAFLATVISPFLVNFSGAFLALQVLAQTQENRKTEADRLKQQGIQQYNTNQIREALQSWQQALTIYRQIENREGEAQCLNNLGIAYHFLGEYGQAIEHYLQSIEIYRQINISLGEAKSLNNLSLTYINLGQYQKAVEYLQQSLEIHRKIDNLDGEAANLDNLGMAYQELGQYQKAREYHQDSLKISRDLDIPLGEAKSLNNLGDIYRNQGKYHQAIEHYLQSIAIKRKIGDKRGEAVSLGNLAIAYRKLGEYQKAIEYHQNSLKIKRTIKNKQGEAIELNNLAVTYYTIKQYASAEKRLYEALDILESLLVDLPDPLKVSLFDTQANSYLLLKEVLIAQNKTDKALEISERGRARVLVELLGKELDSSIKAPTIEEIQEIADQQNATLVHYSILDNKFTSEKLYIWVVKPTGEITFKEVDLKSISPLKLEEYVTLTRQYIGSKEPHTIFDFRPTQELTRLQQLYQLLIEPIADLLPTNENDLVIFIPHRELSLVPFPALQDAERKYLIEKHTILTAPSIQSLDSTSKHQKRITDKGLTGNVLVVGNPTMPKQGVGRERKPLGPLKGAETEATNIEKLLNNVDTFNIKLFLGNQATETTIVQQMPNAQIIHLATHGLLDDLNTVGSPGAIALAPDDKNDGFLTSGEILERFVIPDNSLLNAELVVLSACDTGGGKITEDGAMGLSRSLIAAGVPSVVVSLWKVPDKATTELMTEFYRNLYKEKLDKAQALRQAMLMMFKNNPDPKDWAAFTLIGEVE